MSQPPDLGKNWLRDLVDMSQAGPRRRRWTSGALLVGEFVPVLVGLVVILAVWEGYKSQDLGVLTIGAVLAVVAAAARTFKGYIDRRDKEKRESVDASRLEAKQLLESQLADAQAAIEGSYKVGVEDGANRVFGNWLRTARLHEDGMENMNRQLASQNKNFVFPDAIDSYLSAIASAFDAFYPSDATTFTVSIAVVDKSHEKLHLVRLQPGGGDRSNPLPRSYDLAKEGWGMADCFNQAKIVYTPDVQDEGNDGTRGYLSVVNFYVKTAEGLVAAVINIDSPRTEAFVSEERVREVWRYCLPILSSISISLSDPRMFKDVRA